MEQKFKDDLQQFWNFAVGAAAVGAEKTRDVAKKLAKRGKEEWDASADQRAELKKRLKACKEEFLKKCAKDSNDTENAFDAILNRLDTLTDEELEKLRDILNEIDRKKR